MNRGSMRAGLFALMLALACAVGTGEPAQAQDSGWGFGTDAGFITGTTNNTVFALNSLAM